MLIDLISPSNQISFNIKLAKVVGLEAAVYISELLNINEKACRKSKITDGYFAVDRAYIESRTTLSEEKQLNLDEGLVKSNIISKQDDNIIKLDINILATITCETTLDFVEDISKKMSVKKSKKSKNEAIHDRLMTKISTKDAELRAAYSNWIDALLIKFGPITNAQIELSQKQLNEYTNYDLDLALTILNIATVNSYRDITWAINNYNKNKSVFIQPKIVTLNQSADITSISTTGY